MFGPGYFGTGYFGPGYFGPGGVVAPPVSPPVISVSGLAIRIKGKVVEITDDTEHKPHPVIFSAFRVSFVKQIPIGIWSIDDSDNEPEPRQAGLVLTAGFYYIDSGPEVPRGLTMTIEDKVVFLRT